MNIDKLKKEIQILINQFNVKNFEHVIKKGKTILNKNPEYTILYNLVGSSYQNLGEYIEAEKYFKNGLKLDTKNLALMNNLAMVYKNLLEFQLSENLYLRIISIEKKYINAYVNLGNLKRDLNKFEEAIKLYEKALEISNNNTIVNYSLALAYQGIGDFKKSVFYSKKTLKIDPNFTRADHLISQSTKYTNNDEHYLNLKKKINEINPKSLEMVDIYFSLSKAEEDLRNIKEAAKYMKDGNKLKKELIKYNITEDINLFKNIKEQFDKFKTKKINSNIDDNIIFILGMPRSGTSLVEQIISSHSNVFGCGELPIMSKIIKNNFLNEKNDFVENIENMIEDPLKLNEIKLEYSNFIKNFRIKENFITDKAPLNFRWIGFIKLIFPNARIVHCLRNPKDNCLSIFKNLFEGGLNFSYDQDDLVKYYNQYLELMKYWKFVYQDSILDVKYEDLISDNTNEIKRIINYCKLKFENSCLSFHKNKTPIKTMSTAQARKPIYKSSIKSFEKFREFLPILDKCL